MEKQEGKKFDFGKLRWDLIPVEAMELVVANFTQGAIKYGADNWRLGMSFRRMFAALMRHAWRWFWGQKYDPEDGQHHLSAVAFYALCLMQLEIEKPEFDDRPMIGQEQAHETARHKKPSFWRRVYANLSRQTR